jgi:hypothetical protein
VTSASRYAPPTSSTAGVDGIPEIARQEDCQTCFQCEANCPVDALFVALFTGPQPEDSEAKDERGLAESGLLGSYRRSIGWGKGRAPGAGLAVGPPLPGSAGPIIS